MRYQKIIIVGSPGSGKSYLSKELEKITGLPVTHLDNLYWNPGWVETPKEEWINKQKEVIKEDRWIIDGNYNSTLEMRVQAADLVLFLDMSRITCIYRVCRRHGKKRSDLPEFLDEKIDKEFWIFLKWIWDYPKRNHNSLLELSKKYPDKKFIRLKNKKDISLFLEKFTHQGGKKK